MFRKLTLILAVLIVVAAAASPALARQSSSGTPGQKDCTMGGGWTLPHGSTYTSPNGTVWDCVNGSRCFRTRKGRIGCVKSSARTAPSETPAPEHDMAAAQ